MPDALEFDSMINIRPSQSNTSRDIEDESIHTRLKEIVSRPVSDLVWVRSKHLHNMAKAARR
ncbi:MAG: DUF5674 family protein [Candidatus Andersenbacteria bacterium]